MKNLLLPLVLIIAVTTSSFGQISFQYDTLIQHSSNSTVNEVIGKIKFNFQSSSARPANLRWRRTVENVSGGWTTQVCDVNACYPANIDSADFTLMDGDTGSIDVYFNNISTTGYGCVTIEIIEDPESSSPTVTKLIYYGSAGDSIVGCKVVSTNDIKNAANSIQIFPNPATDYIIVKRENNVSAQRIEIYNMLGLKLRSTNVNPSNAITRVELNNIQKGIYMMRVFDAENNVLATKSFSKVR